MSENVRKGMAKGAAWMIAFRVVDQVIGLISTIILARLLLPVDFGIVAMAMVIYALLELLGSLRTDVVLIQKQDAGRGLYDTAWTVNLLLVTGEAVLLALLARPVGAFYEEPRLVMVIYALSFAMFLTCIKNIGIVDFRKNLEFHKEFIYLFSRRITSFLVTVLLAYIYRSYWALIIGIVISRVVELILSYMMHPYRPRPCISDWGEIYDFSKWLYLNNFVYFLNQRLPEFVVGKLSGLTSLGLFNMGYQIGTLPQTALAAPMNRAFLPGYAKLASDNDKLQRSFIDVVSIIALISIPAAAGLSAVAPYAVPILLTEKWNAAIPVMQAAAITGLIGSITSNATYACLAVGKPSYVTTMTLIQMLIMALMMSVGCYYWGAAGAAYGVAGASILTIPVYIYATNKAIGTKVSALIIAIHRQIIGASIMWVVLSRDVWSEYAHNYGQSVWQLAAMISIGAITYITVLTFLWLLERRPDGPEVYFITYSMKGIKRISSFSKA